MKKSLLLSISFLALCIAATQDTVHDGFGNDVFIFKKAYPVDTIGYGHPSYLFNPISTNQMVTFPSDNPYDNHTGLNYGFLQKYSYNGYDLIYGLLRPKILPRSTSPPTRQRGR